jgi:hypothetical protein
MLVIIRLNYWNRLSLHYSRLLPIKKPFITLEIVDQDTTAHWSALSHERWFSLSGFMIEIVTCKCCSLLYSLLRFLGGLSKLLIRRVAVQVVLP